MGLFDYIKSKLGIDHKKEKEIDWGDDKNYTVYTKYMLKNYFVISYKIMFHVATKPLKDFWGKNIQPKLDKHLSCCFDKKKTHDYKNKKANG